MSKRGDKMIDLRCGDCLELMKTIPDESVDLIVTDPPYLINYKTCYRQNKQHRFCKAIKGDTDKNLIENYIKICYRILKNNSAMYMFCSSKTIDFFKATAEKNNFKIKNLIVWDKGNWSAGDLKAQFGQRYEFIMLLNKGRKQFNGKRLNDIWLFPRISGGVKQVHQNQKPVRLLEQCILKHSDENDVVFDGFMGSGSTGVACVNTGRNFIGFEIDKDYYELAQNRISEATQL